MRKYKLVLIGILTLLIFSAYVVGLENIFPKAESEPITLLVDTWPGYIPLYVAYENGFFEEEGVLVKFDILSDSLQVGEEMYLFDSIYQGYPAAYPQAHDGGKINFNTKAVYIFDYSYGGDVIVANSSIESISELKGKNLGIVSLNSFSHVFWVYLLEKNNVSEEEINFVEVGAYDVLDALNAGEIDAGHTWEPIKTAAVEEGYRVLATSKDAPGLIVDVLAIDEKIIENRPKDVQKIVNALLKSYEFIRENSDEAYSLMSNKTGVSLNDLIGMSAGIKLLSLEENYFAMTDFSQDSSLPAVSHFISDFMLEHNQINESFSYEELVDSQFIEKAYRKNKFLI